VPRSARGDPVRMRSLLARVPPPESLAVPLAAVLLTELLVNRVLTRISIFLPAAAAGPMAVVAALGTLFMVAVALLAFVALLSVAIQEGPFAPRALALALLAALAASIPFPSPAGGIVVVSLTAAAVVAFLVRGTHRTEDLPFAIWLGVGVSLLAYGPAASTGDQMFRVGLPAGPAILVAGEVLFLAALAVLGLRSLRGLRPVHAAVASGTVGLLVAAYVRGPALFAAVADWSLGYLFVIPPLFFAAVWLGIAGSLAARRRGDLTTATVIILLLAAGIDLRVSYVAAAVVFAIARWSARPAAMEAGLPRTARTEPAAAVRVTADR